MGNIYMSAGIAFGLVIGLVLVVILFKFANTNHKTKTQYDERQQEVRRKGYQYAFFSLIAYEVVMVLLSTAGRIPLGTEYLFHTGGIIFGCTVLAGYCIWNHVYWGLNNNVKRYIIVLAICVVLNLLPVVRAVREGTLFVQGEMLSALVNLMVLVMMAVLGLEYLIRLLVDAAEAKAED